MWAGYWNNRIIAFKRQGVIVTTRKLRYRQVQDGSGNVRSVAQEKGVDVRMALDIVSLHGNASLTLRFYIVRIAT